MCRYILQTFAKTFEAVFMVSRSVHTKHFNLDLRSYFQTSETSLLKRGDSVSECEGRFWDYPAHKNWFSHTHTHTHTPIHRHTFHTQLFKMSYVSINLPFLHWQECSFIYWVLKLLPEYFPTFKKANFFVLGHMNSNTKIWICLFAYELV